MRPSRNRNTKVAQCSTLDVVDVVGIVEIVAAVVVMVKKMVAGAVIAAVCAVPVIQERSSNRQAAHRQAPRVMVMVIITNRPVPIWQIRRIFKDPKDFCTKF